MAVILNPILFFVTSPRTPSKMRSEVDLLVRNFAGQRWTANRELQAAYMRELSKLPEFKGSSEQNDSAFSARDRITRAPKALGIVNLDDIALTSAGKKYFDDDLTDETFLRQVLKFQVPSPFHKVSKKVVKKFCIRPYLEILRLVHTLGRLTFDELCLFGMQLTDWHDFDAIVEAIRSFRISKEKNKGKYKKFLQLQKGKIVADVYAHEIESGRMRTRESKHVDLDHFIDTKAGNMRDYADACLRYLRATGLVTVSNPGRTISIIESRRDEVDFILKTVDRDPVFVTDKAKYCEHLYSADTPVLLTDDRKTLERKATKCLAVESEAAAKSVSSAELKKKIKHVQEAQKRAIVDAQITELKTFAKYDEVVSTFAAIKSKDVYDPSLALEWNVWRAMTMMDGGNIRANLKFDDAGNPLSTATGNMPDIVCDYGDFYVNVEVTLQTGNKQYETEGEPVSRHLGDTKSKTGKISYCLFVAPTISDGALAHFYTLHKTSVKRYGGKSIVVPLTLDRFVNMLKQSKECGYIPAPEKVRALCEFSMAAANKAEDEEAWYAAISNKADNWLD